jgi:hypothetical protein
VTTSPKNFGRAGCDSLNQQDQSTPQLIRGRGDSFENRRIAGPAPVQGDEAVKNRKDISLAALALLVCSPDSIAGQTVKKKPTTAAPSSIEPLRVGGGELDANTITGQVKRGWSPTNFSFTLMKAEIAGGRLRLSGDFTLHGAPTKQSAQVTATIGGVMSDAANPWPNARQERQSVRKSKQEEQKQGREAKTPETAGQLGQLAQSTQDTARKTPPAPSAATEQTQSLYAQSETSTACSVLFLNLTLPRRLQARIGAIAESLQLGVVLKPFDNERGEAIARQICQLLQTSKSPNQSVNLDQLNRLFVSSN